MRADAGGMRVRCDQRLAKRVLMCARGGKMRGLAGAGQCQAGDDARQIPAAEPRLVQALRGGFADRGKAAPQAKAEIRRPRGRFAEDFAGECAKAGAAVCAAAIDAEQEDIRVHGPDILSGTVSKAFISELRAIHLDVEQRR